jgi:membrane associated rhomboid family serine protease/uncharacterized Zn finger protein (UPF0148 family)
MGEQKTLYRIVFRGDMSFEYEPDEVRENLRNLCRFDDAYLDRIFTGEPAVLKNKLTLETAQKYKAALDKTGAICQLEQLPNTVGPVTVATIELATEQEPHQVATPKTATADACPKCNTPRDGALNCPGCGIIFAKYDRARERQAALDRAEMPVNPAPAQATSAPVEPPDGPSRQPLPRSSTGESTDALDRLFAHLDAHREQAFLLKAFLTIAAILIIKAALGGLIGFFLLFLPFAFWIGIRIQAQNSGQPFLAVLREHITFMPVMYAEGEKKTEGAAWVTYSLIFTNILIFYAYELNVNPQFIFDNLIFLPENPTALNVPLSLFTAFFLHLSSGHLWGNMLFLWAVGTVVEKRIGWQRFLLFYMLCGIMAGLLSALVHYLFSHDALHGLGASGAIAGVMGIFAVRCYFKSMVFPLPILGIFALILPISLKVRLNSLVIIGLFFAMDLSGGIAQAAGTSSSNIGHWAHIGGMLCGVALAMLSNLGEEAIGERHVEISRQVMSKGGDLYAGEESMRLALQHNPDNTEVMLLLAQLLTKFGPDPEGDELYRQSISRLIASKPKEAMAAFRDYYDRTMQPVDPATQLRLAALFQQADDLPWSERCLELLADNPATPAAIRERAVYQCARIKELLGQVDIAMHYYQIFIDNFPESPMIAKAQARLTAG